MQNEFQFAPTETTQTVGLAARQTALATETGADAQTARLVTERLNEITRRAERAKRRSKIGSHVVNLSIIMLGLLLLLRFAPEKSFVFGFQIVLFAGIIISTFLEFRASLWGAPKFDAAELASLGGVKAIPPLFAALENHLSIEDRQAIYTALTLLLPQMRIEDASSLNRCARETINSWIGYVGYHTGNDTALDDLRFAALKALKQVGDATAIPEVKRLANIEASTLREKALRQAARECLPMLRANCGEVETARTLLRASHAENARPDTLLRPASGAGQTNSAELLRPSDGGE